MRLVSNGLRISALLAMLMGLAAGHAAQVSTKEQSLFRHPDVETAWAAVQESHRPLLVYVTRSDCPYCDKMLAETLSNRKLTPALLKQFETVEFTAEARPDLIKHFAIRLCPTVLIVSQEGDFLARIEGFAGPKKFVATIRPAMAKYTDAQRAIAGRPARQVR